MTSSVDGVRVVSVAIGGVIGVLIRYLISAFIKDVAKIPTWWATIGINLFGSFFIGIVYSAGTEYKQMPPEVTLGLQTGVLGGFTTMSGYCLDTALLLEARDNFTGAFYFCLTPVLCLLGCKLGLTIVRAIS